MAEIQGPHTETTSDWHEPTGWARSPEKGWKVQAETVAPFLFFFIISYCTSIALLLSQAIPNYWIPMQSQTDSERRTLKDPIYIFQVFRLQNIQIFLALLQEAAVYSDDSRVPSTPLSEWESSRFVVQCPASTSYRCKVFLL